MLCKDFYTHTFKTFTTIHILSRYHRLLCKDFYTYTFNNGEDTDLKSVECSCRRLWDEYKVNSTSQTQPRYLVGSDAPCWKPRTTPLSGPSPPIPECGDARCFQTSEANPTVMVIQLLGKKSIQTHRDISDVLRHIIKNVSERLVRNIAILGHVTQREFFGKVFFFN
jgi:hypothetical protein